MMKPMPVKPSPGQESVWDYPRPPRLEPVDKRVQIIFDGLSIADTRRSWRVLETSHPPVYYLPPEDIRMEHLISSRGSSWCEWKGEAAYYDVETANRSAEKAAWSYPNPEAAYRPIKNHIAFYAWAMDQCSVDGEIVRPQPGNFYGGWITNDIVGPFKGEPGSWGW